MSFRGLLRPGQGFKLFRVMRKEGGLTKRGRPTTSEDKMRGGFFGIISQASPKEIEQHKQLGTPITHTILQRGTTNRAKANDYLVHGEGDDARYFKVQGKPKDPGELGHFLIYTVEERADLE